MEELANFNLTSSPSSLPDCLVLSQGTTVPPIPHPRRGSNSSFSSLPKQHQNVHSPIIRTSQSSSAGSAFNRESDEDEENNNQHGIGIERINSGSNSRSKKGQSRYVSRSLPVTPRVNGNCPSLQSHHTPLTSSGISSSFVGGIRGSSTPLLMAPHMALHLEGSSNSIGSLSPIASQYVTCSSAIMSEFHEKVLPSSIDYSSLPLPREDTPKVPSRRHISRHSSEPCIHEVPASHLLLSGKCHSCPHRKASAKHKRRLSNEYPGDNESFVEGGEYLLKREMAAEDDAETIEMQWKFIKTMIEELNTCRCQNSRLAIELHQAKMEIQMLKSTLDALSESGFQPGIMTEMVRQIHTAQKIRDEVMMSRIKLANEERDAALGQTIALLEKLGLSPRAPLDALNFNAFIPKDQTNVQASFGKPSEEMNWAAIEEELKALRLALYTQDTPQDKCNSSEAVQAKGKDGCESQDHILDELKTKLTESEMSRKQLRERCSKLERVFSCLRRKVNGLNGVEGSTNVHTHAAPTSLTFVDMALFGADTSSNQNIDSDSSTHYTAISDGSPHLPRSKTIPLAETEDSLSSIESGNSSSTSWKHVASTCPPAPPHSTYIPFPIASSPPLHISSSFQQPPSAFTSSTVSTSSLFFASSREEGGNPLMRDGAEISDRGLPPVTTVSLTQGSSLVSKCDLKTNSTRSISSGVSLMGPITEL